MIYSISGTLVKKGENFAVIEVAGLGVKIFTNHRTLDALPLLSASSALLTVFTHLHVREDALELYGFLSPKELEFFELLISISGVGPRSALAIMDVAELKELLSAIKENRPDLLTRASGVGRKTAERIILERKNKVVAEESEAMVKKMETEGDLAETLVGLGYRRDEAKDALSRVDQKIMGLEERLKAALKILSRRG